MSSVHFPPFAGNLFERRGLSIARCLQPLMSNISDSSDAIRFELYQPAFFDSNSIRQLYPQYGSAMVWEYDQLLAKKPNRLEKPSLVVLLPKDQFYMIIEYSDRPDAVFPAHQDSGWISSFSLMSNILDNPTK